ncbi:uncharacterized protein LOC122511489 [Leptopilina heterotoma]|uniref:uncharacterized protein LOC122511489 n=1 Tax=Leptopilina heterotoma TaxID=63436 RepID=UPI001CA9FC72|nr:uncharacterized protein LOC122511489 [Leptopilina heterotoma]
MKEQVKMEKLLLLKEQTKSISLRMIDQACQTSKESLKISSTPISSCSNTQLVTSEKQSGVDLFFQMSREVHRPKSLYDLEETTTDGNMIRDLFFKCPNFTDSELLATFYQ